MRILSILAFSAVVAIDAHAQGVEVPPMAETIDANGVNLHTADIKISEPEVAIGGDKGGLSFVRTRQSRQSWHPSSVGFGVGATWFGSNLVGYYAADADQIGAVVFNGESERFYQTSPIVPSGSKIELVNGKYVYISPNGTKVTFDPNVAQGIWFSYVGSGSGISLSPQALVTKAEFPSGEVWEWSYVNSAEAGLPPVFSSYGSRIQSVTSNLGYRIHFQYQSDAANSASTLIPWSTLSKVVALDVSANPCSPTATGCSDSLGGDWPYISYSYEPGGLAETVTDRMGLSVRYGYNVYGSAGGCGESYRRDLVSVRSPSASTQDDLTLNMCRIPWQNDMFSGMFFGSLDIVGASGGYNYTYWNYSGYTTDVVGPQGFTRRGFRAFGELYLQKIPVLTGLTTNGRAETYQYDSFMRPTRVNRPDGDYTIIAYDLRGNVTSSRTVAKPGSGLADIYQYASYPEPGAIVCVNAVTCNKPLWVTVPGAYSSNPSSLPKTDYTYDPVHGGVLTETGPAPGSGPYATVRPQKRYTYNDGGIGVWRVETEKSCRTTTSCAGTSDELVVQTSYDAKRRPVKIVTRSGDLAVAIGSSCPDDARCSEVNMTYTHVGDVASVDGPAYGSADTSYTTYDAMRRKIFEIGPDPDGVGGQPRVIVKHTYDADGNETLTQTGVGSATNGSDFVARQYASMSYDSFGRVTRTESGKY